MGLGEQTGTHHRSSALLRVSGTGHPQRGQAELGGPWCDPVPLLLSVPVGFGDPGAAFLPAGFTDGGTGPLPGQVPLGTLFPR